MNIRLWMLTAILTLCSATKSVAQYTYTNEEDLRAAVNNDGLTGTIVLGDDIELTNRLNVGYDVDHGSDLNHVTIDLNGHTLSRSLAAADDGGQVISVFGGWTLTIKDSSGDNSGKITGGWSYQGGAIYVYPDAQLTIEGGTITGNRADTKGGGYGFGGAIENHGTMTMTGGKITGNTAGQYGGGIYNAEGATLNVTGGTITGNTAASQGGGIYHEGLGGKLNMQGSPVVKDNTTDDVRLAPGQIITVTGAFTSGASIGVAASVPGIFTTGYGNYNTASPEKYFFVNSPTMTGIVTLSGGEASISLSYNYVERAWDEKAQKVTETIKTCTSFTSLYGTDTENWLPLYGGWYVVTENSQFKTVTIEGDDVHLIIPDGVTLTVTGGIRLMTGHKLTIYGQSNDSGMLRVSNRFYSGAGIGSFWDEETGEHAAGELVIHGGDLEIRGGYYSAGIGSCMKSKEEDTYLCNTVTVFGGKLKVVAGHQSAGIGGGAGLYDYGNHGGTFIMYGGYVHAQALDSGSGGTGVGGGAGYNPEFFTEHCNGGHGGTVKVYGGQLNAYGGKKSAGIGTCDFNAPGDTDDVYVYISGGTVNAYGGEGGAGIGGGVNGCGGTVTITGGTVNAIGGKYGAGIGGGENAQGGTFHITGGTVTAKGGSGAAGIGGGDGSSGYGGKNYILGGTVIAEAGTQGGEGNRAIGPGDNIEWEEDLNFHLELGNEMKVSAGNEGNADLTRFPNGERVAACMYRSYARIEPCTHEESTTYTYELEQHKGNCNYCNLEAGGDHVLVNGQCQKCKAVILNDGSDNSTILSSNAGTTCPAVFIKGRTLYKGGNWNTLCLPFDIDNFEGTPLEGATVKTLSTTAFDAGTLTLDFSENSLSAIEAGKPYIVRWGNTEGTEETEGAEIVSPVFNNVTISNTINNVETDEVTFSGIFSPYSIEGEDRTMLYLGGDNKLYYPNGAMTIGSCRAYFRLADGLTAGEPTTAGAQGIKAFALNFEDDETSGIRSLTPNPSPKGKGSDCWYTLGGRRLTGKPTQKGIYINNGNKVVIK